MSDKVSFGDSEQLGDLEQRLVFLRGLAEAFASERDELERSLERLKAQRQKLQSDNDNLSVEAENDRAAAKKRDEERKREDQEHLSQVSLLNIRLNESKTKNSGLEQSLAAARQEIKDNKMQYEEKEREIRKKLREVQDEFSRKDKEYAQQRAAADQETKRHEDQLGRLQSERDNLQQQISRDEMARQEAAKDLRKVLNAFLHEGNEHQQQLDADIKAGADDIRTIEELVKWLDNLRGSLSSSHSNMTPYEVAEDLKAMRNCLSDWKKRYDQQLIGIADAKTDYRNRTNLLWNQLWDQLGDLQYCLNPEQDAASDITPVRKDVKKDVRKDRQERGSSFKRSIAAIAVGTIVVGAGAAAYLFRAPISSIERSEIYSPDTSASVEKTVVKDRYDLTDLTDQQCYLPNAPSSIVAHSSTVASFSSVLSDNISDAGITVSLGDAGTASRSTFTYDAGAADAGYAGAISDDASDTLYKPEAKSSSKLKEKSLSKLPPRPSPASNPKPIAEIVDPSGSSNYDLNHDVNDKSDADDESGRDAGSILPDKPSVQRSNKLCSADDISSENIDGRTYYRVGDDRTLYALDKTVIYSMGIIGVTVNKNVAGTVLVNSMPRDSTSGRELLSKWQPNLERWKEKCRPFYDAVTAALQRSNVSSDTDGGEQ